MWWERWPERFEQEWNCLQAHNLEPEETSTPEAKSKGYRSIKVNYALPDGQRLPITLAFPPEYPFFMAVAFLDPGEHLLSRHHNPTNGELCLLNAGQSWTPTSLIGNILMEMLPKILEIDKEPDGEFAREQEVSQGEPVTGYYPKGNQSLLLIEDLKVPKHFTEGRFEARALDGNGKNLRCALVKVTNRACGSSVSASSQLTDKLKKNAIISGYWKRLDLGVSEFARLGNNLLPLAELIHKPTYGNFRNHKARSESLLLALFSEETRQGVYQDSWLGIHLVPGARHQGKRSKKSGSQRAGTFLPIFGAPYDSETRWARSPELQELEGKHVCIVGAGMLGSPIAVQLARAGVGKLSIVDHDFVELATVIRYGLGGQYAGWEKVEALSDHIRRNYVLTEVEPIPYRIGTPFLTEGAAAEKSHLAIKSADLIIDAAAERSISYYLNDLLLESDTPWIAVTTRPGTWGGETWIMRSEGPCWACFEAHNRDETLPIPHGDPENPELQIGGCSQLTTTGYGLDSDIYALNAVRAAVGLLTSEKSGYPMPDWNALVMNHRDTMGFYVTPQFTAFTKEHHPDCPCCGLATE